MGLCMYNEKTGKTFEIGYMGYYALRHAILESVSKTLADEWGKIPIHETVSYYFVKKTKELNLHDLIMLSDCNGVLDRRQVKRINKGLKNIERVNNICNKKFQELKLFFEQAAIEDGTIIFY